MDTKYRGLPIVWSLKGARSRNFRQFQGSFSTDQIIIELTKISTQYRLKTVEEL